MSSLTFQQTKDYDRKAAWKVFRARDLTAHAYSPASRLAPQPLGRIEWHTDHYAFSSRGHMPTFSVTELREIINFIEASS